MKAKGTLTENERKPKGKPKVKEHQAGNGRAPGGDWAGTGRGLGGHRAGTGRARAPGGHRAGTMRNLTSASMGQ